MRRAARALAIGACAAFAGFCQPAAAHPHAWVVNVTTFVFEGTAVRAVRFAWTFDEFFTAEIVERFDLNRDGRFDTSEIAAIAAGAFAMLQDQNYFVHVLLDGREMNPVTVEGFTARLSHDRLIYEFTVPLPAAVDPAAVDAIVTVYDDTHFVEVALEAADPVRFEGMSPGRCAFVIRESLSGGMEPDLAPYQLVSLTCRPG